MDNDILLLQNADQKVDHHQGCLEEPLLGEGASVLLVRTHLLGEVHQDGSQGGPRQMSLKMCKL